MQWKNARNYISPFIHLTLSVLWAQPILGILTEVSKHVRQQNNIKFQYFLKVSVIQKYIRTKQSIMFLDAEAL